jgi:hypothetical protein
MCFAGPGRQGQERGSTAGYRVKKWGSSGGVKKWGRWGVCGHSSLLYPMYRACDGTTDRLICVNAYVYVCSLSDHSDGCWSHRDTPYGRTTSLPVVALRHSLWSHYVTPGGRTTSLPVVALRHSRWSHYVTPGGRTTSLPVVALRHSLWSHYVTPGGRTTSLPTIALRHSLRSHYVTPYDRTTPPQTLPDPP